MRFPILRFGVAPVVDGPEFRASLQQVGHALGYWLGTTVQSRVAGGQAQLMELLSQGQIDAAWVAPVVALDCVERRTARPRIATVRQGETVYHSVLFSREDSRIKSLADLQKVIAVWVGPESASGYLVPLASLRARGVSLGRAFSEQQFGGTHEAVMRAVAEGRADVGACFAHFHPDDAHQLVASSWTEANVEEKFRVLLAAGPIPTDVIVTHRSMDEGHQQALMAAFDWLVLQPEPAAAAKAVFQCDGFAACGDEHLRGLSKLVRLIERPSFA